MNAIETIDRLCEVVKMQAEIINRQALFIAEMSAVDEETKKEFDDDRRKAEDELKLLGQDSPFVSLNA